jgi:hypothetical protein
MKGFLKAVGVASLKDFVTHVRVHFGNPFIRLLVAFGNSFVKALAAF